jgi:hypothetical protein
MKRILISVLLIALGTTLLRAQSTTEQGKSPEAVVEAFWRMEINGGRLTQEGWYNNAAKFFFAQPTQPPEYKNVSVVSDDFKVGNLEAGKSSAEVYGACKEFGQIDTNLRFVQRIEPVPCGISVVAGKWFKYYLILTTKHWEVGPDGAALEQATVPAAWRIRDFQTPVYLNANAAISYVTAMRDKSSSPSIKKNADATLTTLRKLK